MVQTPTKRQASNSPDGSRPTKRALTSSPEEGEVDDATVIPGSNHSILPPRPPSPVRLSAKSKVAFPFKKKVDVVNNGVVMESKEKVTTVVYERSEEDERRIREADMKRKSSRGIQGDSRWRPPPPTHGDHWEPTMGYGRDAAQLQRGTARDSSHYNGDRHHSTYNSRDRDRVVRESRSEWDYAATSSSSRSHHRRDRDHTSPSPPSPNRSRSPSSHSSQHREKHRLPAPRSPQPTFSLPHRHYGADRSRNRERLRDRSQGQDQDRRYNGDNNDQSHPWDHERIREPHYQREPLEEHDRYWRPEQSTNTHQDHTRDDHAWPRSDSVEGDHRSRLESEDGREHDDHRRPDDYQQSSHGPQTISRSPTPRRGSPIPKSHTPPPPPHSPPPPPPPVETLKDQTLPIEHLTVSISLPMKRPGAPKEIHSPPSLRLPVAEDVDARGQREGGKTPERNRDRDNGHGPEKTQDSHKGNVVALVRKRTPVQRSPKEEEEAYGRVFQGCGKQKDYEITTKLGEGTFGEVHKAVHKSTRKFVALKRILMHNEKEGMPVTALREIKILKALHHPCIVQILDMFVVRSTAKDRLSVYMVFPYMDHDLAGLLENERVKLQPSHIKLYMKQLLEGTEYMHRNHILHRDMKAANLLISNSGSLRIADFGLARAFDSNITRGEHRERRYTNCVVTRWYRPPELLLGARQYGGEVDIWGIGCVLGEMFSRRPILPGSSDLDQLEKIWALCGTPNQHNWPNHDALPGCEGVKRFNTTYPRRIRSVYDSIGPETCDLLDKLLTCNPKERITASQALDHDYFWTDPLPADPKTLPSYEASHEFDRRGRRNPPAAAGPPPHPQGNEHLRPAQPPMAKPPLYFGRGGPPREAFHTGPPPPSLPPQAYPHPNHFPNQHPHRPAHPPYPNGPAHPNHPPRMPYAMQGPSHPQNAYRPGQPPLPGQHRQDRWEPPLNKPSHLPPRPPVPLGRGGYHHRGGVGGAGGHRNNVNSDGGGELNYG